PRARKARARAARVRAALPAGRRAGGWRFHRAGVGATGPASVGGRRRLAPLDSRAVGEVPRTRRGGVGLGEVAPRGVGGRGGRAWVPRTAASRGARGPRRSLGRAAPDRTP